MTAKEAIEIINPELSATAEGYEKSVNAGCEHSEDYEAWMEACRMAFEALKKQVPMKPKLYEDRYYMCPCGEILKFKNEPGLPFCLGCGQALDWGAEE